MCRSQHHGQMTGSCSHLFQEHNFFKCWSLDTVQRARRDNAKAKQRGVREEVGRAAWGRGDVGDEEGPLPRLWAAAAFKIGRDWTGGAAGLLLSDNDHMLPPLITLILSVQGKNARQSEHPHKHTHSQVSSTQCLWQLILHMLFPWEHCRRVFSASVTKAVGFLGGWLCRRKLWSQAV